MNSTTRLQLSNIVNASVKQAMTDPATAGLLGAAIGPVGAGIYSGSTNRDLGAGLRTMGRSALEGVGGFAGGSLAGVVAALLMRRLRVNHGIKPQLPMTAGSLLGFLGGSAHGAASSAANINRERHPVHNWLNQHLRF